MTGAFCAMCFALVVYFSAILHKRERVMAQIEVIHATGILPYEPIGFTNCVLYRDVLYLSGISATDQNGHAVGDTIEEQTVKTFQNIETVLKVAGSGLDNILQMTSFVIDLPRNGWGYVNTRKKILTAP